MNRKILPAPLLMLMVLSLAFGLTACGGEPEETPAPLEPAHILKITDLLRNNVKEDPNADYEGPAYVFCRVSIEAMSEEDLDVLSDHEVKIRDIINTIMRSKTLAELKSANAKDVLKKQLSEMVVEALEDYRITELKGIYFTEYYTTP